MVRTRADAGATKVSAAKAPRKILSAPGGAGMSSSPIGGKPGKDRYSGGNSYNPQPTPEWQKGINSFFKAASKPQDGEGSSNSENGSSSSNSTPVECVKSSPSKEGTSSSFNGSNSSNSTPVKSVQPSPSKEGTSSSFEKNGMVSDDDD